MEESTQSSRAPERQQVQSSGRIGILAVNFMVLLGVIWIVPSQVMTLVRDGQILFNKSNYRSETVNVVTTTWIKKASWPSWRGKRWLYVQTEVNGERLKLPSSDFKDAPERGETVKVWMNPSATSLGLRLNAAAFVGDAYFQKVTPGRITVRVILVSALLAAGVFSWSRLSRWSRKRRRINPSQKAASQE